MIKFIWLLWMTINLIKILFIYRLLEYLFYKENIEEWYDASKWRCLFVRYQKQTSKSFDAYKNILTYVKLKTVSISIVTYVNVTQFVCLFRKDERTASQYPSCARIFE